jgi:peptide/nickel transport system substrate-binding protein
MNRSCSLLPWLFIGLLALSTASPLIGPREAYAQQVPQGPFLDKIIIFRQPTEDSALPLIERGEMDIWLWNFRSDANIKRAETETDKFQALKVWSGGFQLLVNPLETERDFNPFSIREVREALNWLIDRDFLVRELLRGNGAPRWTMFRTVSPDYSRVVDFMKQLEAKYQYNFEKAKNQIFEALGKAGATLEKGKWMKDGKPVVARMLIRTEDHRKPLGDYVSDQLEKLGFTVERDYKTAGAAFRLWGAFAPSKRGDWHIYTAGWAYTSITAYDDTDPWFYYSEDNAPLFREHSVTPLLREALDTLNGGKYKTAQERIELVKRITDLALQDGVHVWVYDTFETYPASARLGQAVLDLYGGPFSLWFFRTIRLKAGPGGEVKMGNRVMFVEGFNTVAGFSWLFDVFASYLVFDPGVYIHPHTGRYIPFRGSFVVDTRGPDGKLDVPADAITYDVSTDSFKPVGSGVKATSKVTFTYTLGKWHDGTTISRADFLDGIRLVFRVTTPGTEIYDPIAATPTRKLFTSNLRGFKFISDSQVEVYLDYWHLDPTYITNVADIFPSEPWTLRKVEEDLVAAKKSAWSVDRADELGVEMLDLTKGPSLPLLKEAYDRLSKANFIPKHLEGVVSPAEASARWKALGDFNAKYGHWLVGNGPYIFEKADPTALQMSFIAFRDYPFPANKWDDLLTVKKPDVRVTQVPAEVVPGLDAVLEAATSVAGQPYEGAEIRYILTDPKGALLTSGVAEKVGGGRHQIKLPAALTANFAVGTYTLTLIAVGEEAALPTLTQATFTVIPALAYFEKLVKEAEAKLTANLAATDSRVGQLDAKASEIAGSVSALSSNVSSLTTLVYVSIVLAIVGIALAALSMRRRPA